MNASINGLLKFFRRKSLAGLIECADGYTLSDEEARAYLKWCSSNGYTDLKSAPDYHEIKDKLIPLIS
jgi:hypothetical protein